MAVRVFVVSCFLVKVSSLNVNYSLGHNILELYSVLIQTRFTTSKTKLDIQYSKLDIRVASRVAERLKIQDLKTQENLKFGWRHSPAPSPPPPPPEIKLPQQQSKNTPKQISNFSLYVQFYWIGPFCPKYFAQDCRLDLKHCCFVRFE